MRVALFSYGIFDFTMGWANALADMVDILLIMPDAARSMPGNLDPRVQVLFLDQVPMNDQLGQTNNLRVIRRALQQFQPDVLHVQQGFFWLNLLLPHLSRYPLVITVHDPLPHLGDQEAWFTPQWLLRAGWDQAQQLFVHAHHLKDIVVQELGYPAERVHVVPLVLVPEDASPEYANGVVHQEKIILFFGRIWEYKGLEYLIRAEPYITAQVPEARILIAGRGENFERYRAMMQTPEHFIIHNQFIPENERASYFRRASVVALPYVDASQTGIIPQASRYERPVVATTVGSLPELIDDRKTGLLVPPRDERALASAIVRLLKNSEIAHQMGRAARLKYDRDSAPEVIAPLTVDIYRKAIASAGEKRGSAL